MSLRNALVLAGLVVLQGSLTPVGNAQSSTFDTSGDGWLSVTLPCGTVPCPPPTNPPVEVGGVTPSVHSPGGGNPGGWLMATDPDGMGAGNSQYWRAPAAFVGDKSANYGCLLRYDIRLLSGAGTYAQEDVLLVGNGLTLTYSSPTPPAPSAWTTFTIALVAGPWRVGGTGGPVATEPQIQGVLAALDTLYVRGEYQLRTDSFGIDNVYFGPTPATTYCTAGSSAVGCQAVLSATGAASATASSGFTVFGTGVEGNKDGLLFYGANGRQAAPWGNGTSFQCVTPPVKRGGLLAGVGTNGSCDGLFAQDLNARWCPTCPRPSHNPGAGTLVQTQLWYRDPFNTSNQSTSLSDALEFLVCP